MSQPCRDLKGMEEKAAWKRSSEETARKKQLAQFSKMWQITSELHLARPHLSLVKATKIAGAAFCAMLVFGISLLATCPALHELIHPDACEADHECAITLFAHGQIHQAVTAVPIVQRSEPVAVFIQTWREVSFVSTDVPLLPGRDPPSLLSLLS